MDFLIILNTLTTPIPLATLIKFSSFILTS